MTRQRRPWSMPLSVAAGYTLIAAGWIVFSDRLVTWIADGDAGRMAQLQSWKGIGFVLMTGILLGIVLFAWNHYRSRMESRLHVMSERRDRDLARIRGELNDFMHAITHDLRAPLRALSGFSSTLVVDKAGELDARAMKDLQHINDAANRLSDMIEGLISLSRLSQRPLSRTEFDMDALAREVAGKIREKYPHDDTEVNFTDLPVIEADRDLVRRALYELFDNTWKFSRPVNRAIIDFRATRERGAVVFQLKDNGVGFDEQYRDKLFMPFQRMHSDTDFEGLGLGLAAVQRVIARHGGWIELDGVRDTGVTVRFTLGEGRHGP